MRARIVSRRAFLNDAALAAFIACLSGCTSTVTRYRKDGTPYTVEEEDELKTLAGVVLFLLLVGAAVASKRDDESSLH